MRFWRTEFTKSMPVDKFDKQYAYNVRYNYGKEGKRTDYTPYSCMKIIMSAPATGDYHGCPFRHHEKDQLTATLRKNNVTSGQIAEINELVKNHHYQVPDAFVLLFADAVLRALCRWHASATLHLCTMVRRVSVRALTPIRTLVRAWNIIRRRRARIKMSSRRNPRQLEVHPAPVGSDFGEYY